MNVVPLQRSLRRRLSGVAINLGLLLATLMAVGVTGELVWRLFPGLLPTGAYGIRTACQCHRS